MRVGSRGGGAAALPCSRAHLPLPPQPGPGSLGGGGAAAGTRSPRLHKGRGVSAPLAGAARPGGEVQGVPARREGGAV